MRSGARCAVLRGVATHASLEMLRQIPREHLRGAKLKRGKWWRGPDGGGGQVSTVEKKPHFRTRGGHVGRRPLMGGETAM